MFNNIWEKPDNLKAKAAFFAPLDLACKLMELNI